MTGSRSEHFRDDDVVLYRGDALVILRGLGTASADACVTSPPYLDARPEYPSPTLSEFEAIFAELRRVVRGCLVLNVGRLFRDGVETLWHMPLIDAARDAGWPLRDTLVWIKPNANPITGPVLANSHEYVFLFGDGFDVEAVRTPYAEASIDRLRRRWGASSRVKGLGDEATMRRRSANSENPNGARARSFVIVYTGRGKGNPHPAPMPLELATHLVTLAGGRSIIDPFAGSGTTLLAARNQSKTAVGIERDEAYCAFASNRLSQQSLLALADGFEF